ncbi:MAG: hypothetical protein Ta2B_02770 [Termitinemataceae bacterium]|nr:MAG: hypothetical protein Ta2B_02770 [Termitinemataceae bacterium]
MAGFKSAGLVLALIAALMLSACSNGSEEEIAEIRDSNNKDKTTAPPATTITITGLGDYSGALTVNYAETPTSTTIKNISGTMTAGGTVQLSSQPPVGSLIVSIVPGTEAPIYIGRLTGSSAISLKLNLTAPSGNLELRPADSESIIPIGTYAEFQLINTVTDALSKDYIQEASLDLMGNSGISGVPEWVPIGTDTAPFTGTFDGANKTIDRLYINDDTKNNVGLFGCAGGAATITGVHIKSGAITGKENVGGILGQGTGNISFSSNNAQINGTKYVGGIAGNMEAANSTLFASYNTGNIGGSGTNTGGLAGSFKGDVTACYNTGEVRGYNTSTGGLFGRAESKITACYNTGAVWSAADEHVCGLIGTCFGEIIACYNTGNVDSSGKTFGVAWFGTISPTACYWKEDASDVGYELSDSGAFVDYPAPDTTASSEWGTGDGSESGKYWKAGTTNGTMLPKLWYEE